MSFRSPYEDLYEFNEDFRNKVNLIRKKCRKESILRQIEKLKQELKELEEEDE